MLLHNFLEHYFAEIEVAVTQLPAYAENYVEEILTSERANLHIRLRFQNGSLLEINEAIIVENDALKTLGYRYHFQNAGNKLVFRYDNTPHLPDLPSFPHHKHLGNTVVASSKPDLLDVLQEAKINSWFAQITQLTGRRYTGQYSSTKEQARALIDQGVNAAKQLDLATGVALGQTQAAALTSDIVWMVEERVTLTTSKCGNSFDKAG